MPTAEAPRTRHRSTPCDSRRAESLIEKARQQRIAAIFFAVQGLISAGYIAYILAYIDVVRQFTTEESAQVVSLVILGVSFLFEAIFEIPAGRVSDRRGHLATVRLSLGWYTVHALLYVVAAVAASTALPIAMGLLLIGAGELALRGGIALESGALSSWFVTSMRSAGYRGELAGYMAKRRLVTNLVWLVVGGLVLTALDSLGPWRLYFPFIISAVMYASALVVARAFARSAKRESSELSAHAGSFRLGLRQIGSNRILRGVIVTHTVFWTLGLLLLYYFKVPLEPLRDEPVPISFSTAAICAWACMLVMRTLASYTMSSVSERLLSRYRLVIYIAGQLLMAGPVFLIASTFNGQPMDTPRALIIFFLLLAVTRFGQEICKPLALAWIHEVIGSPGNEELEHNRATIESIVEATSVLGMVVVAGMALLSMLDWVPFGKDETVIPIMAVVGLAIVAVNIPMSLMALRRK